jgi:hypothetical protein
MNPQQDPQWEILVFVYNADSGPFSAVFDFAHKVISPQTYQCQLCALTYGNFAMKKEWKDFLQTLKPRKVFLHKDEFCRTYPDLSGTALPAVFGVKGARMSIVISADEFGRLKDLEKLKHVLLQRLQL